MRQVRGLFEPDVERSLILRQALTCDAVAYVSRSTERFRPEILRDVFMLQHCPNEVFKRAVHSFCNSDLLWCVRARLLMMYTIFSEKVFELII